MAGEFRDHKFYEHIAVLSTHIRDVNTQRGYSVRRNLYRIVWSPVVHSQINTGISRLHIVLLGILLLVGQDTEEIANK